MAVWKSTEDHVIGRTRERERDMYTQYLFTVHDIGIYIYIYMKCSIIYTHIPSSKQLSLPRICSHIYSHISRNPLAIALFGLR